MRSILIAALAAGAAIAAAESAGASSLDTFSATASERTSITVIGCPACVKAAAEAAKQKEALPPGTIRHELKQVDGQMMLYTTEAMLGGSPVTIVRKATDYDIATYGGKPATETAQAPAAPATTPAIAGMAGTPRPEPAPESSIDTESKTAALSAAPAEAEPLVVPAQPTFDASNLTLRTTLD